MFKKYLLARVENIDNLDDLKKFMVEIVPLFAEMIESIKELQKKINC